MVVKQTWVLWISIRPTINKLNMEQIKSIFYKEIAYPYSNNQYGLAIIIMMQKKCLYFDSSSFYFVKSPSDNFNKQKWNIVSKNLKSFSAWCKVLVGCSPESAVAGGRKPGCGLLPKPRLPLCREHTTKSKFSLEVR